MKLLYCLNKRLLIKIVAIFYIKAFQKFKLQMFSFYTESKFYSSHVIQNLNQQTEYFLQIKLVFFLPIIQQND